MKGDLRRDLRRRQQCELFKGKEDVDASTVRKINPTISWYLDVYRPSVRDKEPHAQAVSLCPLGRGSCHSYAVVTPARHQAWTNFCLFWGSQKHDCGDCEERRCTTLQSVGRRVLQVRSIPIGGLWMFKTWYQRLTCYTASSWDRTSVRARELIGASQ